MGGLRYKTEKNSEFLDNNHTFASPPWTSIRELENASLKLEGEDAEKNSSYRRWLNLLVGPGSSLGGTRPKAVVRDSDNHLWIAKFPGRNDEVDSGAWEMVVHELAQRAGIKMSACRAEKFTSRHHTFLTKRFDRFPMQERIHYSSAMTMLGYGDGAGAAAGVSYIEIAEFLVRHGASPDEDLKQLWKRVVFSIAVSNTDDHLRNHGFLLTPFGWRLSPAFDINPDPQGTGLSLNITENDNHLDPDLTLEIAPFFRVEHKEGKEIITKTVGVVSLWAAIADTYGIGSFEKELMSGAFASRR